MRSAASNIFAQRWQISQLLQFRDLFSFFIARICITGEVCFVIVTVDFTKLLPKYSKFRSKVRKFVAKFKSSYIGGPKMSGNFVHCKRERQLIVYIYNIHSTQFRVFPISTRVDVTVCQHGNCFIFLKYYICKQ